MRNSLLISIFAVLLVSHSAYADTCSDQMVSGAKQSSGQAEAFCSAFPYAPAVQQSLIPATAGSVSLGSSTLYFGGVHGSFYTTASSDLAATGSVQGDAALITTALTYVTGADATKGVKLPATGQTNAKYIIVNTAAAVLKIWPNTLDTINATAADNSVSVAASTVTECWRRSATAWWCNEGVAP